jgi:lambda family phage tail tape measure protein
MADLNYDVRVNTQQALASLQRLEVQVGRLSGNMEKVNKTSSAFASSLRALGATVAGIGIGRFVDDIQNMQNKLLLASTSQDEFNKSLAYVKAIADQTGQSLAATGALYAKVAANAEKMGYTQEQVATVTSAFALALKASGASAEGAASSIYQFSQILAKGKVNGDEFTTIMENLGGPVMDLVASKLGVTTAELFKMKEEGKLTAAMFSDALIQSFDELNAMSGRLGPTIGQAFTKIGNSFSQFLMNLEKSTGVFTAIANAMTFLANNTKGVGVALAIVGGAWTAVKLAAWSGYLITAAAGVITLTKTIRNLGIAAAVAEAIATGGLSSIATLTTGLAGAAAAGIAASVMFDKLQENTKDFNIDLTKVGQTAKQQLGDGVRAETALTVQEMKRLRDETNAIVSSIARTISGYKQSNEEKIKGLNFDRESLTMTTAQKDAKANQLEAERAYTAEMTRLKQQYADISNTGSENEKKQLPLVAQAMDSLTRKYQEHRAEIALVSEELSREQAQRNLTLYAISEQIRAQNDLMKIQDDTAKLTMTEIEQKYYDIDVAARNSAKAAIEAEMARRNVTKLDPAEVEAYYNTAMRGSAKLKEATRRQFEESRSFSTGWKRAFNEYAENAGNAAKRAENLFKTATSGMEEAIVGFAKTGKFEWKNFVSMMLEELLRSQIQQAFAQMMGNMQGTMRGMSGGGGGNLLGNLAGLFGSSSFMPGESGGIPSSAGNIFGDLLGGIGSGITSVFSGIGDLFGGFFANGGNLGAGKWGIAGENGPEIISGPATVTPMGMGSSTYVTYNINAVDAMSFKQLVAQDPGFIHAVAMQGARSTPGTRR